MRLAPLSHASLIGRTDGLIQAEVDKETILMSIESGVCYGLNHTGSRIWALLAEPMRIGDICSALIAEYEVEANVCEDQVIDLLEEMRAENLIATREER